MARLPCGFYIVSRDELVVASLHNPQRGRGEFHVAIEQPHDDLTMRANNRMQVTHILTTSPALNADPLMLVTFTLYTRSSPNPGPMKLSLTLTSFRRSWKPPLNKGAGVADLASEGAIVVTRRESQQTAPDEALARFLGDHDLTTSTETDVLLARLVGTNQLVTVDLSEATFIDSSFLHALVNAHRDALGRGTRLCVRVGTAAAVEQILRISGLIHTLDVVETEDAPAIQPLPEHFAQAISG